MAKRLLLVRHGATDANRKGCFNGSTDTPLGTLGQQQSRVAAAMIKEISPGWLAASPLQRTMASAELVGQMACLTTNVDPDLREIDFGDWEGKTFAEIASSCQPEIKMWQNYDLNFTFPGGESIGEFLGRVHDAADKYCSMPHERICLVTHGGVIRAMICHLLHLPPQNYILFDVKPGSVAVIDIFDQGGILSGLNVATTYD